MQYWSPTPNQIKLAICTTYVLFIAVVKLMYKSTSQLHYVQISFVQIPQPNYDLLNKVTASAIQLNRKLTTISGCAVQSCAAKWKARNEYVACSRMSPSHTFFLLYSILMTLGCLSPSALINTAIIPTHRPTPMSTQACGHLCFLLWKLWFEEDRSTANLSPAVESGVAFEWAWLVQ